MSPLGAGGSSSEPNMPNRSKAMAGEAAKVLIDTPPRTAMATPAQPCFRPLPFRSRVFDVTKHGPPVIRTGPLSPLATACPQRFVCQPSIPSSRPRFDAGQPSVTTPHRVVKVVPRLMSQSGKPRPHHQRGQSRPVPQPFVQSAPGKDGNRASRREPGTAGSLV